MNTEQLKQEAEHIQTRHPRARLVYISPEKVLALLECVDALRSMLEQFTKTPSTLKDSQARCKGHAALQKLEAL